MEYTIFSIASRGKLTWTLSTLPLPEIEETLKEKMRLIMDILTATTLNLVGRTCSAILTGEKTDEERKYALKVSILRTLTPVVFDGRSFCIRYFDWEGSQEDNSRLNSNTLKPINVIHTKAIYQGWVTCFPADIKNVEAGEYFAFNADDCYGNKLELADGSSFNLVGTIYDELVWRKN